MVAANRLGLTVYLVDYINEELSRGAKEVTHEMMCNAIGAFEGGAHNGKEYAVHVKEIA